MMETGTTIAPNTTQNSAHVVPWDFANEGRVHYSVTASRTLQTPPPYVKGLECPMMVAANFSLNRVTLAVVACGLIWACLSMVRRAFVLPGILVGSLYIATFIVLLWVLLEPIRAMWPGKRFTMRHLDVGPDPAFRIRCVAEGRHVDALGKIADHALEPETFDASLAEGGAPGGRWTRVACSLVGFAFLFVAWKLASGRWLLINGDGAMIGVLFMLGAVVGGVASAFIWPVYYRVVPGRLDRITTGFLARGPVVKRSWNLKQCGVLADLTRRVVAIDPPGSPRLVLQTSLLGKKYEFERAVLLGAVSTAEAPGGEDEPFAV
jgi:hypothetical protein